MKFYSIFLYLKKFNPNIFRTIYLDDNKFVNPHQHQKRLFISSNPTFRYLQHNVPANFLCPRYPQPHIPVIWSMLVKGRYNPVYTGLNYVIEFPNHYHTGLLRCSFVSGKKPIRAHLLLLLVLFVKITVIHLKNRLQFTIIYRLLYINLFL